MQKIWSIKEISKPLNDHFSISYFAFKRTYSDNSKIYLFNNPELYEHWFKKEYYKIGNREGSKTDFSDSSDLWLMLPDPFNLYHEMRTLFNVFNGITITKTHPNHCDFYFFGSTADNHKINNFYLSNLNILTEFNKYFLDRARPIIEKVSKSKLIFPYEGHPILNNNSINLTEPNNQYIDKKLNFLVEIRSNQKLSNHITNRECSCIPFIASGHTNAEIANQLNISVRTVESHIESIKRKFNCSSKQQLISLLNFALY